MRPLLLDLFCGAGGAGMGYHRAGFEVIGVDLSPQPNYPFEFIQDDALAILESLLWGRERGMKGRWAAIHASPPCQRYSAMSSCRPGTAEKYPDLVNEVRNLLERCNHQQWRRMPPPIPYVIENVPGSPLRDPITLCGTMFGYELYRHRLFESNVELRAPMHFKHDKPASKAGHWKPGTVMSVSGHVSPVKLAREIMDIDWCTRDELAEAIPPYYTEYIGRQLLEHLTQNEDVA